MEPKPRVLIAAQPAAAGVLRGMHGEVFDLVLVHDTAAALAALERRGGSIALVVCTIEFDESRMFDFLESVKRSPGTGGTPFVCCRVLPSVLSKDSRKRLGDVCRYFGAADYVDVADLVKERGITAATAQVRDVMFRARCARRAGAHPR